MNLLYGKEMKSEYHGCNFLDTNLDMDVVDTFHHLDQMVSLYLLPVYPPTQILCIGNDETF